jgi:hypothetical protein
MTRPPLNGMQPRTLREASRDPCDWISGPHQGGRPSAAERAAGVALALVIAVTGALVLFYALAGG